MKLSDTKDMAYAYIYFSGDTVIVHRKRIGAAEVEHATVHIGAFTVHRGLGRLVVHGREIMAMLLKSRWIGWQGPSVTHGSPLTKERGIRIGCVYMDFGAGETWLHTFPDLISCDLTIQEDHGPFLYNSDCWRFGDVQISRVYGKEEEKG